MFRNEVNTIGVLASSKVDHMKNHPARYFTLTLLAGMFIGFGVLLDFSLGAMLTDSHVPGVKIFMGLAFGVALSLVIISGGELFTGNNLTMSDGILSLIHIFLLQLYKDECLSLFLYIYHRFLSDREFCVR